MATKINEKASTNIASKKWRAEVQAHIKTKLLLKEEINKYKEAMDIISVLTQENLELNKIHKDDIKRYEKECYNATIQNGNVINLVKLDAYREYIPMHEIDQRTKYINTALYQSNAHLQFVEFNNGIEIINEEKYKKYIGGLI